MIINIKFIKFEYTMLNRSTTSGHLSYLKRQILKRGIHLRIKYLSINNNIILHTNASATI